MTLANIQLFFAFAKHHKHEIFVSD